MDSVFHKICTNILLIAYFLFKLNGIENTAIHKHHLQNFYVYPSI